MLGNNGGFGNQSDQGKTSEVVCHGKDRTSETYLQERPMSSPPKVLIIDDFLARGKTIDALARPDVTHDPDEDDEDDDEED